MEEGGNLNVLYLFTCFRYLRWYDMCLGGKIMKEKQKIQKLIDLILEEEQFLHDYWCSHKDCPEVSQGLGLINGMCDEHGESKWCEKNCKMLHETPKKNYEKCIRHWYLEED